MHAGSALTIAPSAAFSLNRVGVQPAAGSETSSADVPLLDSTKTGMSTSGH